MNDALNNQFPWPVQCIPYSLAKLPSVLNSRPQSVSTFGAIFICKLMFKYE